MQTLLQISWRVRQWKNYENRPTFDEVIVKIKRCTFFLRHSVLLVLICHLFFSKNLQHLMQRVSLLPHCAITVYAMALCQSVSQSVSLSIRSWCFIKRAKCVVQTALRGSSVNVAFWYQMSCSYSSGVIFNQGKGVPNALSMKNCTTNNFVDHILSV